MAHERHAEGEFNPLDEKPFRDTVAVGIAQQGDMVGALNASTCPVLLYSRNPALDAAFVLRAGGALVSATSTSPFGRT
jgi:hypothetical protein